MTKEKKVLFGVSQKECTLKANQYGSAIYASLEGPFNENELVLTCGFPGGTMGSFQITNISEDEDNISFNIEAGQIEFKGGYGRTEYFKGLVIDAFSLVGKDVRNVQNYGKSREVKTGNTD